jgi:hypothetical protein
MARGEGAHILWADDGVFEVISFVRGPWEDEALAL